MKYTRLLKNISPMMYGDDVRAVQQKLNELSYNTGAIDGWFGKNTENAVLLFQKQNNLEADGIVGINAWNKLFNNNLINTKFITNDLIEFVKSYEGFSAIPYDDCAGIKTIGYGSTSGWIIKKSRVTESEALQALSEELNSLAEQIENDLNSKYINLNRQQFDALCSFAYNCGIGALFSSILYRKICNNINDSSLKENFEAWCHNDKGGVIKGLLNRRREEYNIFMYGNYNKIRLNKK
ncbi:MAG: glycoside hydrolase family protein [Solirubrobacterales bacterium]